MRWIFTGAAIHDVHLELNCKRWVSGASIFSQRWDIDYVLQEMDQTLSFFILPKLFFFLAWPQWLVLDLATQRVKGSENCFNKPSRMWTALLHWHTHIQPCDFTATHSNWVPLWFSEEEKLKFYFLYHLPPNRSTADEVPDHPWAEGLMSRASGNGWQTVSQSVGRIRSRFSPFIGFSHLPFSKDSLGKFWRTNERRHFCVSTTCDVVVNH